MKRTFINAVLSVLFVKIAAAQNLNDIKNFQKRIANIGLIFAYN